MEEKEKVSRKEKNKRRFLEAALESFIENGIENTKIADIAEKVQLTERSAFRYFESKAHLVEETALLFWTESVNYVRNFDHDVNKYSGIELIYNIFKEYANLFFTNRKKFIFIQEAEVYLTRWKKGEWNLRKPPVAFDESNSPLAIAIRKGLEDKTVSNNINLEYLYLNSFDSLLGLLQKLSINYEANLVDKKSAEERLDLFCKELTNSFRR